jgi:5,5'-dehydrodivanillate O-demethylase
MLADDLNELYTRIGPGTRMGALLRRYWYPFAAAADMEKRWTKKIRLLGEELVLFKDRQDRFGLIAEQCPHRRASFLYGIPTEDGLRCPYHGWEFDAAGVCLDQPNEPNHGSLRGKCIATAYPVEVLGGMLFAYMGPLPAPILPRWDGFVVEGAVRTCGRAVIPVNWLQIMENSVDPIHTEWLHGKHYEFINEGEGVKVPISRHHLKIAFDEFEFGIVKRRLLEGQSEESDDWQVGHPMVFPNMLSVGNGNADARSYNFQIRVPVDDTNTLHLWYTAYVPPKNAAVPQHLKDRVTMYDVPFLDENGEHIVDFLDGEDIMAWVTQGRIADRAGEHLGTTDSGIVMLRRILERELDKIERGEDPIGVLRDPTRNGPISLPVERNKHHFSDGFAARLLRGQGRYMPIKDELIALFADG